MNIKSLKPEVNEKRKRLSEDILYYRTKMLTSGDEYTAEALDVLIGEYEYLMKNEENYIEI